MTNLEPYENEFVLSYKQEFEPNYRSIQQGDDTDFDESDVEFGDHRCIVFKTKNSNYRLHISKL